MPNESITPPAQSSVPPAMPEPLSDIGGGKMPFIIAAVALVILLVGGFLFYTKVIIPKKIKEKVTMTQQIVEDLNKTSEKVSDHLSKNTNSGSGSSSEFDPEVFTTEAEKGEGYVKDAEANSKKLQDAINGLSMSQVTAYKSEVKSYLDKSNKLLAVEKDIVKLFKAYSGPMKEFDQIQKDMRQAGQTAEGIDQYVAKVKESVSKMKGIVDELEKVKFEGDMQKLHESFTNTFRLLADDFDRLVKAIDDRSLAELDSVQLKIAQDERDNLKDINMYMDRIDSNGKTLTSDVNSQFGKVKDEYDNLAREYDF